MAKTTRAKSQSAKSIILEARWSFAALVILLVAALGVRMIDIADPPLDFHPTRQYRGALIARSIYYQLSPVEDAAEQAQALAGRDSVAALEPPIVESIVALSYLAMGAEQLWVAGLISSLFWLAGAYFVYLLIQRMSSSASALIAMAFFLFLPFAVAASRSFQPDPLMVALIAAATYAGYRWAEEGSWKWTAWTGIAAGMAVLVKAVALYFLGGLLIALVLSRMTFRTALKDKQVWAMAAISTILPALYYVPNISSGGGYIENWILRLLPQAFEPGFYIRWPVFLGDLFGLMTVLLGLVGLVLAQGKLRAILLGLWVSYALYGITLPHQTLTHNYYHLPLVLILALSIVPVIDAILSELVKRDRFWRFGFVGLMLAAIAFNAWISRSNFVGVNNEAEISYWTEVGAALPTDGRSIGLVQHYGHLLNYYGRRDIALWPVTGEIQLAALRGNNMDDFEPAFLDRTAGMRYFVVTSFNQLTKQPVLQEYLNTNYAVYADQPGYRIYDLETSLAQ
jgi:hypothetical protein